MMYIMAEGIVTQGFVSKSTTTTAATSYAGHCANCGRVITQTSHRCHKWISITNQGELLNAKPYTLADSTIKQEKSRRDVAAKRKQLRGKRK